MFRGTGPGHVLHGILLNDYSLKINPTKWPGRSMIESHSTGEYCIFVLSVTKATTDARAHTGFNRNLERSVL